ncbi:AAA-like domain-containing protein [Spirosoma endophyticum]|uniref:AAA-like domain-containing protein n=2 Tax=Spirosoma endophyticum TaxID=662367 RepID=A0A1I2BFA0_9BACT|nr:AAA-like domain-containing protein [Spirosoma endophyticum]
MDNLINDFDELEHTFTPYNEFVGNDYSINIPLVANGIFYGMEKGWVNILNPFRGGLVLGSPGSGKTKTVSHHFVKQLIEKGFVTALYEYTDDYLSQVAFHTLQANQHVFKKEYGVNATFHAVNFLSPAHSVRCNPFAGNQLRDIIDAQNIATTILCNLNKSWIEQQGSFLVESAITYLTACLWFLKRYSDAQPEFSQKEETDKLAAKYNNTPPVTYCSLPHFIEFALQDYRTVLALLGTLPELALLIEPFQHYLEKGTSTGSFDHLDGILAVVRLQLRHLATPELYWIMTGEEPLVDINKPNDPKIVSLINNPASSSTSGVALALLAGRVSRQINKPDGGKKALIVDELPTVYIDGLDSLMATGRLNKVATLFTAQDMIQLELTYGKRQAKFILDVPGTIITGPCLGMSAERVASRLNEVEESIRNEYGSKKAPVITGKMLQSMPYGYFAGNIAPSLPEKVGQSKFISQLPQPPTPWQTNRQPAILPVHPALEGLTNEQIEVRFQENIEVVKNQIGDLIRNAGSQPNWSPEGRY